MEDILVGSVSETALEVLKGIWEESLLLLLLHSIHRREDEEHLCADLPKLARRERSMQLLELPFCSFKGARELHYFAGVKYRTV